jgi:hypothetical protein
VGLTCHPLQEWIWGSVLGSETTKYGLTCHPLQGWIWGQFWVVKQRSMGSMKMSRYLNREESPRDVVNIFVMSGLAILGVKKNFPTGSPSGSLIYCVLHPATSARKKRRALLALPSRLSTSSARSSPFPHAAHAVAFPALIPPHACSVASSLEKIFEENEHLSSKLHTRRRPSRTGKQEENRRLKK